MKIWMIVLLLLTSQYAFANPEDRPKSTSIPTIPLSIPTTHSGMPISSPEGSISPDPTSLKPQISQPNQNPNIATLPPGQQTDSEPPKPNVPTPPLPNNSAPLPPPLPDKNAPKPITKPKLPQPVQNQ